jgi:hypothetical protein
MPLTNGQRVTLLKIDDMMAMTHPLAPAEVPNWRSPAL